MSASYKTICPIHNRSKHFLTFNNNFYCRRTGPIVKRKTRSIQIKDFPHMKTHLLENTISSSNKSNLIWQHIKTQRSGLATQRFTLRKVLSYMEHISKFTIMIFYMAYYLYRRGLKRFFRIH